MSSSSSLHVGLFLVSVAFPPIVGIFERIDRSLVLDYFRDSIPRFSGSLRLGFRPQGWDIGLMDDIWALNLEFGPEG